MENKEPAWKKILNVTSNAVMVNGLFLLCCIPIVTIGQAWSGLYTAIRYAIRGDGWFAGFKAGVKTRFWRGTLAWTACMAAVLYIGFNFLDMLGQVPIVTMVVHGLFLLLAMMITAALIPLNVYIPTTKTQWLINGVNLCFRAPLQVALTGVLMWAPLALAIVVLKFGFFLPVLFIMVFLLGYFTVTVLIATILLKKPLIQTKLEMEQLEQEAEEEK